MSELFKFSVRSKLCIEKTGSFLFAEKNKMIPGNVKLLVSIVIPCKWPVSQLSRNFDLNMAGKQCFILLTL